MRADPSSRGDDTGAETTPQLNVWLLGTFRVAAGTRVIHDSAWRLRRARSLVKLLALAPGHRLHREQVIEALWPELDPGRATNSLHQVLHLTRHTLQPELPPRTTPDYISLRDDVITLCSMGSPWVDCDAFAAAAARARHTRDPAAYSEALDLYSGILLPSDLYEDWAGARREELQQLHQALLWELATLYQDRRDLTSAQAVFERLVAADPLQEEAHVALMRLHAISGRSPQALRQYDRLRETLERELGTQPAEDSQRLHREILEGRYAQKAALDEAAMATAAVRAGRKKVHRAWRPPAARPLLSNLPAPITSFIGREREKAEVKALLSRSRFVTLTGTGGAGKTRLALEVAGEMLPEFPDGVWLVELAPLSDGALLTHTLASALNVGEQPGRPILATLTDSLGQKHLLLVLDNCEQLADATAALAGALLQACPRVHILATSRERLKVAGENIWRVSSLSVPDPRHLGTPTMLNEYEAIRLFVERGAAVSPDFALTERNAQDVGRICWHLDGLPLPIELAASRLNVLSPRQIADRLADRFRLLKTESALVSPRHRTLEAVMGWSYDLLSDEERRLFRRLSVFAGGFTLEAAEAVYDGRADEFDLIDLLTRLVDKSLIIPEDHDGEVRYRLLETVRQYGQDKLIESGEAEEIRHRHRDLFLSLAEEAEPQVTGREQKLWLHRLEREHDNLRAALAWSLTHKEAEAGLRLASALWRFWYIRAHWSEGRHWLEATLSADGAMATLWHARALLGAATLASEQGDYQSAAAFLQKSRALSVQLGDRHGLALSTTGFGILASRQGDYASARSYHEESLSLARQLGDELLINLGVNNLGAVALNLGDYASARPPLEESVRLARRRGDKWILGTSLKNLGTVASQQGDHGSARPLHAEALTLKWEIGDKRGVAECFEALAVVEGAQGSAERAARLLGAAEALREAIDAPIIQALRAIYLRTLDSVRSALTKEAFAASWAAGKAMPLEEAIDYALALATRVSTDVEREAGKSGAGDIIEQQSPRP